MVKFQFKGLMVPVFTPLTNDRNGINIDVIEKYGQLLKLKGVQGILVNGAVGEGTSLRMEERRRLAEEWLKVSRKHGLTMMLSIGGVGIADVHDLVQHADKIGVNAIVLLPDLFERPRIEEDLVDYIRDISKLTMLPIYYHHIPEHTNVELNLLRLNELLQRTVTNWSGIYYRDTNLEVAHDLLKEGVNVIVSTDTILTGVLSLGFDAISSIAMNLWPENVVEIRDLVLNNKLREAREANDKLHRRIRDIVPTPTADWIGIMKLQMNKMVDINLGGLRKPHVTWNMNRKH